MYRRNTAQDSRFLIIFLLGWSDMEHYRLSFVSFDASFHNNEPFSPRQKLGTLHHRCPRNFLFMVEAFLFYANVVVVCSICAHDNWDIYRYQNFPFDLLCWSPCYIKLPLHHWSLYINKALRPKRRQRIQNYWREKFHFSLCLRLHANPWGTRRRWLWW